MKKFICTSVLGLLSSFGYSQVVAIQLDKMNVLYLCVPNSVTIAVENTSSKSVIVTTDNGRIENGPYAAEGHYTAWPAHDGVATIYVKKKTKSGLKIIGETKFRVKKILAPVPRFGGKSGGEIAAAMVRVQIAPSAQIMDFDFDAKYIITDFTVIVTRHNRELFKRSMHDMNGARIDKETNSFFTRLRNNDKLIFTDIKVKDCNGSPGELVSMQFIITNAHKYHRTRRPKHGEQEVIDPVTGETKIIKW